MTKHFILIAAVLLPVSSLFAETPPSFLPSAPSGMLPPGEVLPGTTHPTGDSFVPVTPWLQRDYQTLCPEFQPASCGCGSRSSRCWLHDWCCSNCNFHPSWEYCPPLKGNYYFRAYHPEHLPAQQAFVAAYGGDIRNPYDNRVFDRIYDVLDETRREPVGPRNGGGVAGPASRERHLAQELPTEPLASGVRATGATSVAATGALPESGARLFTIE